MGDVHIQIDIRAGNRGALSKVVAHMQTLDRDFPAMSDSRTWWHKPPDNARAMLARSLSYHGLTGRLSVVGSPPYDGTNPYTAIPEPVWSGFTAKKKEV